MIPTALAAVVACSGGQPQPTPPAKPATWRAPDGRVHRATSALDKLERCQRNDDNCDCESHSDCTAKPGGECHSGPYGGYGYDPGTVQTCRYPCRSDGDCGADRLCAPAGVFGPVATCVSASCRGDADCADESGEAGRCAALPEVESDRTAYHCVYPSYECGPDRPCKPAQVDGEMRELYCEFGGRIARCAVVPEPVPATP